MKVSPTLGAIFALYLNPAVAQLPSLPTLSIPTAFLTFSIPSELPSFAIPTELPTFSIPSELPSFAIPTELPTFSIPSGLPSFAIPTGILTFSIPMGLPTFVASTTLPTLSIPTTLGLPPTLPTILSDSDNKGRVRDNFERTHPRQIVPIDA
ncbi:hypothetical protein BJX99DRAFT_265384 [Aspergillus californicus]